MTSPGAGGAGAADGPAGGAPPADGGLPLPARIGRGVEEACSAAITLFILYTIAVGRLPSDLQNAIILTLSLVAVIAGRGGARDGRRGWGDAALRIALIGGAVWSGAYFMTNYEAIAALRAGLPNSMDLACYAVGLVVVADAARRAEGALFLGVVVAFFLYILFGDHLGGLLGHRPFSLAEALETAYSHQGVYGVAFSSVVNVVWIFVILGVALRVTGAGDFFNFIADRLTRRLRSGPAQCAVIGSALFGSINGSAPANVASTGVITIPMMKRAGFSPSFAAATEASASCVGQLLPPVMGVGAFIMSEITGVPYVTIMAAAIAPALLYILAIAASVAFEANRLAIPYGRRDERTVWGAERWAQSATLVATFATLLTMLFSGYSATYAGFGAIVACLVTATAFPALRLDRRRWRDLIVSGGREGLALAVACAALGIVIVGFTTTGLGVKLNQAIVALGGDSMLLALVLAAVCAIVIGMGLPTAAAYLTVAFIAGPAIIALGVDQLQAHLFVFYYAVLSAITPPVALALFAASAIAQTSPIRAAGTVLRLSFPGFVLPIAWIYHPELTLGAGAGDGFDWIVAMVLFAVAIIAVAAAGIGFGERRLAPWERGALFAAAVLIVWPNPVMTALGLGCALLIAARQLRAKGESHVEDRVT